MGLKAFVCISLGVPNGQQGCMFTPINVDVTTYEPEVVGLQLCAKSIDAGVAAGKTKTVSPMVEIKQVAEASDKLVGLLDEILVYVNDVLSGKQQPDNTVGRSLLDLIHSVPNMTQEQFVQMFNSNVKDLLMVVTLSGLLKTQLQLNEKLSFLYSSS